MSEKTVTYLRILNAQMCKMDGIGIKKNRNKIYRNIVYENSIRIRWKIKMNMNI